MGQVDLDSPGRDPRSQGWQGGKLASMVMDWLGGRVKLAISSGKLGGQ